MNFKFCAIPCTQKVRHNYIHFCVCMCVCKCKCIIEQNAHIFQQDLFFLNTFDFDDFICFFLLIMYIIYIIFIFVTSIKNFVVNK